MPLSYEYSSHYDNLYHHIRRTLTDDMLQGEGGGRERKGTKRGKREACPGLEIAMSGFLLLLSVILYSCSPGRTLRQIKLHIFCV